MTDNHTPADLDDLKEPKLDEDEWPNEAWLCYIDDYAPNAFAYFSQPDGGVKYIHSQVVEKQEAYLKHMVEQERKRLATAVKAAVAAEREANATLAERRWREWIEHSGVSCDATACEDIAAAIRARSTTQKGD